MGETTISWADYTLNHGFGCTKATYVNAAGKTVVHPACEHCYAEKWCARYGVVWGRGQLRKVKVDWSQPEAWLRKAVRERAVHTVFWESLGDILDEENDRQPELQAAFTRACEFFARAAPSRNGGYGLRPLALTKRPERWQLIPAGLRPEVWFGTSVADQETAEIWVARLLAADWVLQEGEFGRGAREFDLAWARSLRAQCRTAGVAYHLKQVGSNPVHNITPEHETLKQMRPLRLRDKHGGNPSEWPEAIRVREFPEALFR